MQVCRCLQTANWSTDQSKWCNACSLCFAHPSSAEGTIVLVFCAINTELMESGLILRIISGLNDHQIICFSKLQFILCACATDAAAFLRSIVKNFCPWSMSQLEICWIHHLLDVSLLWLGIFQIFPNCLVTSDVDMVGHFPTVQCDPTFMNNFQRSLHVSCLQMVNSQGIQTFGVASSFIFGATNDWINLTCRVGQIFLRLKTKTERTQSRAETVLRSKRKSAIWFGVQKNVVTSPISNDFYFCWSRILCSNAWPLGFRKSKHCAEGNSLFKSWIHL